MELKEALNDHRLRAELLPRLLVPRKAHDYKAHVADVLQGSSDIQRANLCTVARTVRKAG
jgi:hypothetical protein